LHLAQTAMASENGKGVFDQYSTSFGLERLNVLYTPQNAKDTFL
jgi:hypothetical protein